MRHPHPAAVGGADGKMRNLLHRYEAERFAEQAGLAKPGERVRF